MSVEALNTAIERIVDRESPEISEFAKVTKDLGSTAVFFLLTAAGVFLAAVTADFGRADRALSRAWTAVRAGRIARHDVRNRHGP